MKRIILIVLLSGLFSGCAQLQHSLQVSMLSPIERAKYDCAQMSYKIGTPEYAQCVQNTTANIRTSRAIEYAGSRAAANQAQANARSMMPKTISCSQIGSSISCTEF
jgi:hypothetical protein